MSEEIRKDEIRDIMICKVLFPNDPTGNTVPHQFLIARREEGEMLMFSISSIPGKERRVFGKDRDKYFIIPDFREEGFLKPSFINCSTGFELDVRHLDLSGLKFRDTSEKLKKLILEKISEVETTIYPIDRRQFLRLNPRVKVLRY